ncbi:Tnks [Symbiodinium microadriaticum]|nr:Tnks [Symbiodinium microadriaticum]CAE7938235.1 Tnks [Symbiodinium sp. KB8]
MRRMRASEDSCRGCTPTAGITAFKCEVQPGWVDMNEYLLYHGTSRCNAEQIMARGFDAQRGGESTGAMFGRGVYFAQNASKSDLYTTCDLCEGIGNHDFRQCRHAQGERCILVTRVLLGESKTVKNSADAGGKDQIRAPQREDGTSYDSITALARGEGGVLDHKEFVVFKDRQTLASFRIFYRHDSSCSCNGCQNRTCYPAPADVAQDEVNPDDRTVGQSFQTSPGRDDCECRSLNLLNRACVIFYKCRKTLRNGVGNFAPLLMGLRRLGFA